MAMVRGQQIVEQAPGGIAAARQLLVILRRMLDAREERVVACGPAGDHIARNALEVVADRGEQAAAEIAVPAGERRQRIVVEQHALNAGNPCTPTVVVAKRSGATRHARASQHLGQLATDHVALVRPVFDAEGALMIEDRTEV
jgi:hypothetical protein